jgi:uncharacterized RDD family membrane protein YckC
VNDPGTAPSLLDQRLEIETPERVVIVHDLAGIGSRFAAGLVDACILSIPWCGASCALMAVMPLSNEMNAEELQAIGMALGGVCYAILWLYYLFFESVWGGRTPGKRMLRLRVMSVHGGPAPVSSVILRNVLRVVDSLPTGLIPFVGGVSMFLSSRAQRIGDLAAGTVVVRERQESLRVPARREGDEGPSEQVSAADLEEVDRFLVRRSELLPDARARIAGAICSRLVARYALPAGDPEKVLGLIGARRTPSQIRDLAGPRPVPAPPPPEAAP